MTEGLHDQPANGIHFFIAEMRAESFVEVFNRRQRTNSPGVATELTEINIVFFVVLIFNFTDNQFKDVLNGHQT